MKRILGLFALLVIAGCTLAPQQDPLQLVDEIEVLTLKVTRSNHSGYDVAVILSRLNSSEMPDLSSSVGISAYKGARDVLSAPKIALKSSEWGEIQVVERLGLYKPTTGYLIDGEFIESRANPGITLKMRVDPVDQKIVKVKGLVVFSKFDDSKHRIRTFPIDVVCSVNEEILIYKKQTELIPPENPKPVTLTKPVE